MGNNVRYKVFEEHPEFYEYSLFDSYRGELSPLNSVEFHFLVYPDASMSAGENCKTGEVREAISAIKAKGNYVAYNNPTRSLTHTRFPRRVYFQICHHCNLLCDYCFLGAMPDDRFVPTKYVLDFARFFGNEGLMEVRLTGGEPSLHPDFFKIVEAFQENGIYCSIATNGVWDKKTLDELAKRENIWIIVSIDGSREVHNKLRGETYDIIVKNLVSLREKNSGIRMRLNAVLTKLNMSDIEHLAILAQKVNAESITLIPLRPQVRNPRSKDLMLTSYEFKKVLDSLQQLKEKYGVAFTTTLETDYKKMIKPDPIFRKYSSCAAGREGLNLDFDYEKSLFFVYGCSYCPASDQHADSRLREPFISGYIHPDGVQEFKQIWNSDRQWLIYRNLNLKSKYCKSCAYWVKHLCTGSCPIQNIDYEKLNLSEHVVEQLKEQLRSNAEWYCYQKIVGR